MSGTRALIPLATGLALRNVLWGGLHGELARAGVELTYLVPPGLVSPLDEELGAGPWHVAALPAHSAHRHEVLLREIAFAIAERNLPLRSVDIRRQATRRGLARPPRREWLRWFVGSSWRTYRLMNLLRERLFSARSLQPALRRFRPDVVFSNDVFDFMNAALLRRARLNGIRTVGMVHSWDNPTNKGVLPAEVNELLVWGRVMRDEMTTIHRVPDARITEVGTPQFDVYARPITTTRDDLRARFGFPSEARIILYGTGARIHCELEPRFPEMIADMLPELPGGPVCLVVRPHPRESLERYASLIDRPGVVVEGAGRSSEHVRDTWFPRSEDHDDFVALMRHVDVVVNVASTIALDAAANDKPVVNITFDAEPTQPYLVSIRRLFDYDHISRHMTYQASEVARSPGQLRAAIDACLLHPERRRPQRQRMLHCEGIDAEGRSAARIAAIVAARREQGAP